MARGGRRPGSGRKRIRRESGWFNTRIDAGTRKVLEREARRNHRSLSHEIERRLIASIQHDAAKPDDRENRGLSKLVDEITKFANANARAHWRHNRFAFEVLRAALDEIFVILSRYVPASPTTPSKQFIDDLLPLPAVQKAIERGEDIAAVFSPGDPPSLLNPKSLGCYVANIMWVQARRERPDAVNEMTPPQFVSLPTIRELLGVPDVLTQEEILEARSVAARDFAGLT
jgi:hypothetical protein